MSRDEQRPERPDYGAGVRAMPKRPPDVNAVLRRQHQRVRALPDSEKWIRLPIVRAERTR
jgi:hypothetical protein